MIKRKEASRRRSVRRADDSSMRSGSRLFGFVFHASIYDLEGICDRYLNQDPIGKVSYSPLAPYVVLQFGAHGVPLGPKVPLKLDSATECDLAVWVPVRRAGFAGAMLFSPYMFSSDPIDVLEGRSRYGFPKELGYFDQGDWRKGRFATRAYVVHKLAPGEVGGFGPLLTVERTGAAANPGRSWRAFPEAAAGLQQTLLGRASGGSADAMLSFMLGDFWPPNGPLVQLKQFPDCTDSRYVCYSSIVEARSQVESFVCGRLLPHDYGLTLTRQASHPLAEDLGLRDEPAVLAYELHCSVRVDSGREVWHAPAEILGMPPRPLSEKVAELVSMVSPRRVFDMGGDAVRRVLGSAPPEEPAVPQEQPPLTAPALEGRPERIVILGGGVGAMATAFALTEVPDWKKRYQITVYQLGWRLGGKGASGRNAAYHDRIEEHGLHAWFGFYENAFRMMRRCYEELPERKYAPADRDPLLWGFEPQDDLVLEERVGEQWRHHPLTFPRNNERPGSGDRVELDAADYVTMILRWMAWLLWSSSDLLDELGDAATGLFDLMEELVGLTQPHSASELTSPPDHIGIRWLERFGPIADVVLAPVDHLMDGLWKRLRPVLGTRDEARRLFTAIDFGAAVVRGMLRDDVGGRGFDVLEDEEFGDWLHRHGATEWTLESDWVRAVYGSSFAFLHGDPATPRMGTGAALRWVLRLMATYRGAVLWKMTSGMGDTIFAPLYRVLEQRGVEFRFFHRVRQLHLSGDKASIAGISLGRQATPRPGYPYLKQVKGRWCWPNRPDYDQLAEGKPMRELEKRGEHVNLESAWSAWRPDLEDPVELRRGRHFDRVVLGISLGALAPICSELVEASPRWRQMLEGVETVRTQAFQLWLEAPLPATGYVGRSPILTAYTRPMETWGDFSHTLAAEGWPEKGRPQQVAYFCGPMPDSPEPAHYSDSGFPDRMRKEVFRTMSRFVANDLRHLWPSWFGPKGFDWTQLTDPSGAKGEQRLAAQFWTANIDPSERYVLSVPGSAKFRLRSDDSQFSNLLLAGDWTFNGLNVGCVEAAVMSGFRAARAICGEPVHIVGEEHLHRGTAPAPEPPAAGGAPPGTPPAARRGGGTRRITGNGAAKAPKKKTTAGRRRRLAAARRVPARRDT